MALSIIFSSILFLLSMICVVYRLVASPACAFLGLLVISMGHTDEGFPLLPIGNGMLLGWLFMTLLVMIVTLCQPSPLRNTRRGMGYYLVSAICGVAVGMLGFTFITSIGGRYVFMIVTVAVSIFIGALMYSNTPAGRPVGIASGHFFKYFLAKGFPTAISFMQLGTVVVLSGL